MGARIPLYIILILLALFFILPLVWMLSTAFKPFQEVLQPNWLPIHPTLENFTSIFSDPTVPVYNWFLNSVLISSIFTILILVVDSLAGYAYARMEFPGRTILFSLLIATLVMPGLMFLIPNYITISQLRWINSYQGVILPGLAGVFGVFYMRQFFQGLPRELEEAARIDGANAWQIFFQVALPLSLRRAGNARSALFSRLVERFPLALLDSHRPHESNLASRSRNAAGTIHL